MADVIDLASTGKPSIMLHQYAINGVAWGREIVFLDSESKFAAIVTRANLLPLEGVREDLIAERPTLLDSISARATLVRKSPQLCSAIRFEQLPKARSRWREQRLSTAQRGHQLRMAWSSSAAIASKRWGRDHQRRFLPERR